MGVFAFRQNPTGAVMDDADFVATALQQPMSIGATLVDLFKGDVGGSFLGLASRDAALPEEAPTTPSLLYTPPDVTSADGGAAEVRAPDTPEMRARLSGASRGALAAPIPYRVETPSELEARRQAAGAITEAQFKASPSYREGVPWDAGMTEARARALADDFDRRKVREFFAEKRPISAIAAQFGAGLFDPLNFIPFAGPTVKAAAVARLGRIGGSAAIGAADAAAGAALATVASIPLRKQFGEEISWQSTVSDIAISAAVGTAFGSVAGFIGGRLDARRTRLQQAATDKLSTLAATQEGRFALDEAIGQVARGETVDLSPTSRAFLQEAIDRTAELVRRAEGAENLSKPDIGALARHRVAAADGSSIEVVPTIIEARDLITSSDEGFAAALQPRQRDRAASQAQVRQIASSLAPERLGASAEADRGAPIIGPDRMVESGNGRVLAIREAYRAGGDAAERYRAWLEQQGADVSGFAEPVLARVRATPLDDAGRQAFTVAANRPATLAMSATERARADAAALTPETLGLIRNPDDLAAAANADFVRQFVRSLPQSEAGALTTAEGRVSAEGLARVRNAVLAAAYDDADTLARITEATDDGVRSISNALTAAAPTWAAFRRDVAQGRVPRALDATSALLEAVKRTADMRARGVKLADYLRQTDAFDTMPESVEGFMRLMHDPAGRRAASAEHIARGLRRFATEARKVSTDEGLGLGLDPVETRDLMALIRRDADGSQQLELTAGPGNGQDVTGGGLGARGPRDAVGRGPERGGGGPSPQEPGPDAGEGSRPGSGRGLPFDVEAREGRGPDLAGEAPRLEMGRADPLISEDVARAAREAATRISAPEDVRALAEQYGVDPKTGDFVEMAEVDQVRAEGRLDADGEAELADATKTFELGQSYSEALRAAVGCLL